MPDTRRQGEFGSLGDGEPVVESQNDDPEVREFLKQAARLYDKYNMKGNVGFESGGYKAIISFSGVPKA